MGRRRRRPEVHDAHNSAATTSRGPRRSQLVSDRDWAQALKLDRASSHFVADEARRRLFPSDSGELSRRRWGSHFACALFSRTLLFFFFFFFIIVCVLEDLVCVSLFLWNFCFFFFIYFFLYLCLCLVAQKMWKRNGNLDFGWSFKTPT